MHHAVAQKLRVFKAGDHREDALLFPKFEPRLEPDEVVARRLPRLHAKLKGEPLPDFPRETAIGALALYISDTSIGAFQPMNVNFGIMPPLDKRVRNKKERCEKIAARALEALANAKQNI